MATLACPSSLLITAMSAPEAISSDAVAVPQTVEGERRQFLTVAYTELLEEPGDVGRIEWPSVLHGEDVTLGLPCLLCRLSLLGLPQLPGQQGCDREVDSATVRSRPWSWWSSARSHGQR